VYDRADTLALVHQVEGPVDIVERHRERNEFIDLDFAVHVLINHARQL
jgi:hypothetical protein